MAEEELVSKWDQIVGIVCEMQLLGEGSQR